MVFEMYRGKQKLETFDISNTFQSTEHAQACCQIPTLKSKQPFQDFSDSKKDVARQRVDFCIILLEKVLISFVNFVDCLLSFIN